MILPVIMSGGSGSRLWPLSRALHPKQFLALINENTLLQETINRLNGNWLCGDILGLITAKALNIKALAVPVSCNTAIELCGFLSHVERTKIGSPHVIAEFNHLANKYSSVAGFEANGGFLLGSDVKMHGQRLKKLPTRDAVLPAIMLLYAANNKRVSKLVNELPQRYTYSDRIQNFATEKSQIIINQSIKSPKDLLAKLGLENLNILEIDTTDGLRITLADNCIFHLRPSGNAPELRCYAEAATEMMAKEYVHKVLAAMKLIKV